MSTFLSASAQRAGMCSSVNAPPSGALATGKGRFSIGRMSAAVNTPATPGAAAASSVSIETISACG